MAATNEQFDEYVAERTGVRFEELRAKLAAGDADAVADIEERISVLLFDSKQWAELITATAQGRNAYAALQGKAMEAAAELLALKDAEQVERDRANEAAESRFEQRQFERAMA